MVVCALVGAGAVHAATSPVAAENALAGSPSWGSPRPTTAIEGYTSARDTGVVAVCTAATGICLDRTAAPGAVVRYEAVDVDAWGTSVPTLSAPVARRRHG